MTAPDDPAKVEFLRPATQEEVAEALAYALRFDACGKPHRIGHELVAALVADRIAEHLHRAGLRVFRQPPVRPHSA